MYEHYGVYIGNKRIIHYTSESGDIDGDNEIMETSFSRFLRNSNNYFILAFPDEYDEPEKVNFSTDYRRGDSTVNILKDIKKIMKDVDYKLYSPSKTVRRAKSKLGKKKYNLVVNNCEHFAIWCKTGIKESHQVNKVLDKLSSKEKFRV
ncbi:lecithin retinol acyltransferase family protein [Natroniella acetigena]|nr:lecithin retinol acyltransferase family protein [Natroniella acetigena]